MTGQRSFSVLGEAWGAVKIFDQTLTGYRQLINRPYINPQDNRMVPNTFEAYTLSGAASGVSYTGGFIAKMKTRNSDSFDWMSTVAGSKGTHKGVGFAGADVGLREERLREGGRAVRQRPLQQFLRGREVPDRDRRSDPAGARRANSRTRSRSAQEFIGSFSTKHAGVQAAISHGPFGAQLYYTQNGKGFDTQNPFGDHASYLNLMHVAFNTAGEKTWGIGGNVNFASLGAPGLTASAIYASGNDRIDRTTGAAIADRKETDLRADYAFAKDSPLSGLVATLRGGWLHQDGSPTAFQLRVILNYAVPF